MELLRFATAGSVDDGKSTLIGRLLYETKSIMEDQYAAVQHASRRMGLEDVDLALLTDGLRAEREQGITIDVAYRYFSTPRRRFIVADTPGHVRYTRNMVTGASTADLAIILADARNGLTEQSRRHAFICSTLGVPHLVLAVNKMDLVDYDEATFTQICDDFRAFSRRLNVADLTVIPISALHGQNVTAPATEMPWYQGPTLLYHLENVHHASDTNLTDLRLPVQCVIRPRSAEHHDYRGYAGQIASGVLRTGDEVVVLPGGLTSTVAGIDAAWGPVDEAFAPMSVSVTLTDDIDLSRGSMICRPGNQPTVSQDLEATVCWMDAEPLHEKDMLQLKQTTHEVRTKVTEVRYQVDVNTLHRREVSGLGLNEIGRLRLRTTEPLIYDGYRENRETGGFILIDPRTHHTVAAGMLVPAR